MEHGMLFVVTTVVPIISTTSLSPLNSPRPGSSTRLLISMDVTPRRPIHRATPRRQSTRSFSFISISRAFPIHPSRERSALEILFHLASPRAQTIRYIGNIHSHAARVQRAHPPSHAPAHRSASLRSSISRATLAINLRA